MSDYQSNSNKSKIKNVIKDKPKSEKVISGVAKVKKKSDARKIMDAFIPDDIKKVKEYLAMDVLAPTIKKAILDIIINGATTLFYPSGAGKGTGLPGAKISHLNYSGFSNSNNAISQNSDRRNTYDYDEIKFDYQADAEVVLMKMQETIEAYQLVTINDLYDFAGARGDYTSSNYGWTDLRKAYVSRVRDGWIIKLPRAVPID